MRLGVAPRTDTQRDEKLKKLKISKIEFQKKYIHISIRTTCLKYKNRSRFNSQQYGEGLL